MSADVTVLGVGLYGPGLAGWAAAAPILVGRVPWDAAVAPIPSPAMLPPNERRRASAATRLALAVASEAVAMAGTDPGAVRAVWGSGAGDGATLDALLRALTAGEAVSPTQFHNSVHNAVAGYWAIGSGSREATACLGGHRESWAAALLPALAAAHAEPTPLLLCVYDVPTPAPLDRLFPIAFPFACALVLAAGPGGIARLAASWCPGPPSPLPPAQDDLDGLIEGNPAARALPLLRLLAARRPGTVVFGLDGGTLRIGVAPC